MDFGKALEALKAGCKVKLPSWAGYWQKEGDTVMMHCKDGQVLDIRETKDVFYTLDNIASQDWEVVDEEYKVDLNIHTFRFGEALRLLKQGKRLTRRGWKGKGLSVVYQKAYPQGIPCNKQTAEAWGLKEGELFKCEPYLQISTVDGSHAMWFPSIEDCLAEDWEVVEECLSYNDGHHAHGVECDHHVIGHPLPIDIEGHAEGLFQAEDDPEGR